MKKFKNILKLSFITVICFTSCSKESDIELQVYNTFLFQENFNGSVDNTNLDLPLWTNFSQVGTRLWSEQKFYDNGYAEFSSFGSGQLINVGWLISPAINMDLHKGEKLSFQAAQNFLRSKENSLELLVCTDYDETNILNSDWVSVPIVTPTPDTPRFEFVNSGVIDLSKYTGTLHFAFKVKGSGTNSNLTGTYQIDNVGIYYPSK